jgi:hypothetical protein
LFTGGGGNPKVLSTLKNVNTDTEAKIGEVGSQWDWNPSNAEYALTYYIGGRGKFVIQVYKTGESLLKKAFSDGEDLEVNDLPIISRFYRQIYGDAQLKAFKDEVAKATAFDHLTSAQQKEFVNSIYAGKEQSELDRLDFNAKYLDILSGKEGINPLLSKSMSDLLVKSRTYLELDNTIDNMNKDMLSFELIGDKEGAKKLKEERNKIIKSFINNK